MPESNPRSINGDVVGAPTCVVNGPAGNLERNILYPVAPVDAVHEIVIELDDVVEARMSVGVAGGRCGVTVNVDVPELVP